MHNCTLQPENIFLTRGGQLRLGDFGLAVDLARELPFTRSGTLDYMAPEVRASGQVMLRITSGLHRRTA